MVSQGSPLPSSTSHPAAGRAEPGAADRPPVYPRFGRVTALGGLGLAIVFLVLSLYLLQNGVRVRGDGLLYVRGAEQLLRGESLPEVLQSRFWYVALIASCQYTGLGLSGVVVIQLMIAVVAAIALFDLGRQLAGPWAGLLAAALLIANPDIVRWHTYILTDSLYISAVVLATWFTFMAGERDWLWYFVAVAVLLSAALLRPNGWLLVLVSPCYWLARSSLSWRVRLAVIATGLSAFVAGFVILLTARPGLLTNSPDTMLRRGEVVWGYPEWRLPMPPDSDSGPGGMAGAIRYASRHPGACLRLATVRVFTELAHIRPFYSRLHNALLLLFLPPLYALAIVGFLRVRRQPLAQLLLAVIVSHLLVQAVNYADWDGRFLLYVLPLIGVFSSVGLVAVCRRFRAAVYSDSAEPFR